MPRNFDNVSKEVAQGADDVRKNLEGLIESAEHVDEAFAKMSERQKAALDIAEKFDKAMASSAQSLAKLGNIGVFASKGLQTMDTISRSFAVSLMSIGKGSNVALDGLRKIASGASDVGGGFSEAHQSATKLEKKVEKLSKRRVKPIKVDVGGQATQELNKKTSRPKPSKSSDPLMVSQENDKPNTVFMKSRRLGKRSGSYLASSYIDSVLKNIRRVSGQKKDKLSLLQEEFKTNPNVKNLMIGVELDIKRLNVDSDTLRDLTEEEAKAVYKARKKVKPEDIGKAISQGNIPGMDSNRSAVYNLGQKRAADEVTTAYEKIGTQLSMLEEQARKESKTISDLYVKTFAQGGLEASRFADGLAGNATGMLAVGVAGAYLATKMSDVISQFMYAAKGLSSYQVETAALEHTISGFSKGSLEEMRQGLSMTRDQAGEFFKVVKMGVSELGMKKEEIVDVAKALRETFGGDQTDRLREYVDLLKEIPTLKADLSVTASVDDQTAALFGLIEGGKMDVVLDMQSAGLLSGEQKQMDGASMLNANQKAANAMENIQDFMLKTLYPEWGATFTSAVDVATKGLGGTMAIVGMVGAMKMFMGSAHSDSMVAISKASVEIQSAIRQSIGLGGKSDSSITSGGGKVGKGMMKGVGIGLATMAVSTALGKLSENLEDGGDKAGAAVAKAGSSMSNILGSVAMGSIAGPWGMAAGAVVGLAMEAGNLIDVFQKLSVAEKQISAEDQVAIIEQKNMIASGKEIQDTMQQMGKELESGKFKLAEFRKGLAESKIGKMVEFGSSPGEFKGALDDLENAVGQTYNELMGVAEKYREELNKKDLTPQLRKAALEKVTKVELDAAKKFAESMDDIIAKLYDNPELKKKRLETQKAQTELDVGVEAGVFTEAEKTKREEEVASKIQSKIANILEANRTAMSKTLEQIETLKVDSSKVVDEASSNATARASQTGAIMKKKEETNRQLEEAKEKRSKMSSQQFTGGGVSVGPGIAGGSYDTTGSDIVALDKKISELTARKKVEEKEANVSFGESSMASEMDDVFKKIVREGFKPEAIGKALEEVNVKRSDIDKRLSSNKKDSPESLAKFEFDTGALGVIDDSIKSLEKIRDASNGEVKILQAQVDAQSQILRLTEEAVRSSDRARKEFGSEILNKQKQLKMSERDVNISSLLGSGIAERTKVEEEKVVLYNEEYRSLIRGLAGVEKNKRATQEKIVAQKAILKGLEDSGASEAAKSIVSIGIKSLESLSGEFDKQIADQKDVASQTADKIAKIGEGLSEAFRAFDDSLEGVRLQGLEDLSREIAESASYTGEVATASKESFRVAFKAVQERSKKEREIFEDNKKIQKDKIRQNIENAKTDAERYADEKGMSGGDKDNYVKAQIEKTRASSEETYNVWEKVEAAKLENKEKRGVVDAAKAERDLKERELGIQQSLISESLSFISDFGGSFSAVMELHKMDVDIERRRLDSVKEAFSKVAGFGKDSLEYQEAQRDVLVQEMNLRKKELGIQKSLMDRILGAAFGELNQSFGARRQLGSDQGLMGVQNTRMKTQGGMFLSNVPSGGAGTIEERSARRSTGSGWGGSTGGVTGVLGKINEAMKSSPAKNKLEEEVAKATAQTADNTDKIANSTDKMSKGASGAKGVAGVSGEAGKVSGEAGKVVAKSLSETTALIKKELSGGSGTRSSSVVGFQNNDPRSKGGVKMSTKDMERPTGWGGAWEKTGSMGKTSLSSGVGFQNNDPRSKGGVKMGVKSMERPTGWGGVFTKIADMGNLSLSGGVGFKNNDSRSNSGKKMAMKSIDRPTGWGGLSKKADSPYASGSSFYGRPSVSSISKSELSSRAESTSNLGVAGSKGMSGASGEEGSSGQSEAKINGEIVVKFDNAAFKDQVTKVVGSIISTPEMKKGIQNAVYG